MSRTVPFIVPFFILALAACGGSSAGISPTPDGSTPPGDDGGGSNPDATSTPDAPSTGDDGSSAEASTGDDGGGDAGGFDAATCDTLATRKACIACCDKAIPIGANDFNVALHACACQADVCGPVDGGAADAGDAGVADAGDFGTGACAVTCSSNAAPDPTCAKCLSASLGTAASPGQCRASVVSACSTSAPCKRYEACAGACPP